MGEGVYRFGTRRGEDAEIYALLDKYITEVCFCALSIIAVLKLFKF